MGHPPALNPEAAPGVGGSELSAEEAFEAFYRDRYPKLVMTVTLILQDRAMAQDVAQETFARAYLSWPKLWPDGNPGGWVHRVATNLAISIRRRAARELKVLARLQRRDPQTVPGPDVFPELFREVAALPPRQRAAVALYYVQGLSIDECAAAMGCRPGTVKSLLFGARARLREKLGDDDG